jgi:DNA-binding transcriptional ArsR family regulator
MNKSIKEKYQTQSEVFKALSHPTRLFIVDELSKGERCVCDLTDMIGADISTVSKHLKILKYAGIISNDKRGLKVFYSLTMPCIDNFLNCIGT